MAGCRELRSGSGDEDQGGHVFSEAACLPTGPADTSNVLPIVLCVQPPTIVRSFPFAYKNIHKEHELDF